MGQLAAVVLAAGVSSRMGKFKPMLFVDGKTMAQRVTGSMLEAGADPVVVVTGYQGERLERHLQQPGVVFVRNECYCETQMLDSILLGISALPSDVQRLLICPADIPLVKAETIRLLLEDSGDFVRPCCNGKPGHPVLLSARLFPLLKQYHGGNGLRGAAASLGIIPTDVETADEGAVLDGDTRDEYVKLLKYRRRDTGNPQPLQLDFQVRLQAETSFWGPECAQFLELIQMTGSIQNACQCMHMPYSRGWSTINEAERQLGYRLLNRNAGGTGGGGSELTREGAAFLQAYQRMYQEICAQSQRIFSRCFPGVQSAEAEQESGDFE